MLAIDPPNFANDLTIGTTSENDVGSVYISKFVPKCRELELIIVKVLARFLQL